MYNVLPISILKIEPFFSASKRYDVNNKKTHIKVKPTCLFYNNIMFSRDERTSSPSQ